MEYYVFKIITLLGGMALFLFGMDIMGKALKRQAGGRLQTILAKMSSTVYKGFFLGLAATAAIQCSSATTVMVVGFVNSGIMTLKQAVGVIIGSNIGTTVTAWLISLSGLEGESILIQIFKTSTLVPLLGTVGILLYMFTKSEKKQGIGAILLGFLALMTGVEIMSQAMAFLEDEPWFGALMVYFSNPVLGILFGLVLTAVIQSSSASVGILQGLCVTGAVTFGSAIPIILGQNIGACVITLVSAIGANRNARRTAMLHLLFNVLGTLIFVVVFYGLGLFIDWNFLSEPVSAWQIALIHTGFNLATALIFLPLNGVLVKLACLLVPEAKEPERTVLLDERLLATPAVAVQQAHAVSVQMTKDAVRAMDLAVGLLKNYDKAVYEQVQKLENKTDSYEDALGTYLIKLSNQDLTVSDNRLLNTTLYTMADIERIADHAVAVARAATALHEKNIHFSQAARGELAVLAQAVSDVMARTVTAYAHFDRETAAKVEPREQVVDALAREIKARHVQRLRDGVCSVECGFVLEDLLTAFERTADHCSNIAVEMLQVAEGKLEAHEYLNALKAGELQESALFNKNFNRYREQYVFPDEE